MAVMMVMSSLPANAFTLTGDDGVPDVDAKKKKKKKGHSPVTICHKPGTPAENTIVVDNDALAAHLAHGDFRGPCDIIIR